MFIAHVRYHTCCKCKLQHIGYITNDKLKKNKLKNVFPDPLNNKVKS